MHCENMAVGRTQDGAVPQPGQQWPRRRDASARSGSSAHWLLMAALAACAVTTASCAENVTSVRDDAVSECQRLHASNPRSPMSVTFRTGSDGKDFAQMTARSPGGWLLLSVLSLHALDTVEEDGAWTVLCVGLVDTTSYTSRRDYSEYPAAWVTLHTLRQIPIGLVRLRTRCWLSTEHFSSCSPSLTPLPFIENLPLFHYSPLEEDFWTNFTIDSLGVKPNWLWRINTQTNEGSIPADWIYNMQIPSLQSLEILGNDWRRPVKLLNDIPIIERLDLSYNKLEVLPEDMLIRMSTLQEIILGHNNISKYPQSIRHLTKLWLLDLTNPLGNATLQIADEDVEHLPKSLSVLGLENTKLQANVTNILLLPNLLFLNLSGCALGNINDHQFANTNSKLITVDLSHNNLKYLPKNIFSEMPKLKTLIIINNNIEQWSKELLVKNALTHLYLAHNQISNLTPDAFENLKSLETLDLSGNRIDYLFDTLFQDLQNLTKVDISNNLLTSIPDWLFSFTPQINYINLSYNKLKQGPKLWNLHIKTLDLSHNDLTYFTNNMSSIENVDLSYNSLSNMNISSSVLMMNVSYNTISYISPMMWTNFTLLKELDIGGNDFECCLFGKRTFLNEPRETSIWNLKSYDPLTCSINQTSPKILLQTFVYNETECNPLNEIEIVTPFGITVVLPLTLLIVTGTLIAVMMYVYRFELTYVSHLFRMKKIGAETDEQRYKTCVYDAFVCYSAKNFEWVMCTLLPGLEDGAEGYRLCVHDRDFALGAGINRNIVASLEKSRKVIFVLSADFIASKWCQWELEMANHKMFEEKRNYIILVELERLDRRSLPRHLRYLMDRTTYLEWPEGKAGMAGGKGVETESVADAKRLSACFKRLREALGASLYQRTGRDNGGFFTVLDAP